MNQKLIDRIIEVSEWSYAALYDQGRLAFARELRDMIDEDAEPEPEFESPLPKPISETILGPQYTQRDVLIIEAAALFFSTFADIPENAVQCANNLLDAFDASREKKP